MIPINRNRSPILHHFGLTAASLIINFRSSSNSKQCFSICPESTYLSSLHYLPRPSRSCDTVAESNSKSTLNLMSGVEISVRR